MTETEKLKPCPFCGSWNVIAVRAMTGNYMVKCFSCKAGVSFSGLAEKEEVSDAWNKRAVPIKGEWEPGMLGIKCSICGTLFEFLAHAPGFEPVENFCPCCGADMRGRADMRGETK